MTFTLDPRLVQDTAFICDWPLSGLHRMDDRRYAWIVLVPRRAEMSEPFDLPAADQALLWRETMHAAALLKRDTGCRKVNVGALGNIVTQLHVHVVARNEGDVAWPGPVWGKGAAERFGTDALGQEIARLRHVFHPPTD
jgi:diadenosine tetraphosphate (Ap4A) HIT family hydrolase